MFRYPKTNVHARLDGSIIEVAYRFDGDVYRFTDRAQAERQVRILAGGAADDDTIRRFIDAVIAS